MRELKRFIQKNRKMVRVAITALMILTYMVIDKFYDIDAIFILLGVIWALEIRRK